MPVTLNKIHPRVLQIIISEPWTTEELMATYPEAQRLLDAAAPGKKLYTVVDLTATNHLPLGILRARASPQVSHLNSDSVIIIGGNSIVKTIAETGFRLVHYSKVHFVYSQNEAWDYLRSLGIDDAEDKTKSE